MNSLWLAAVGLSLVVLILVTQSAGAIFHLSLHAAFLVAALVLAGTWVAGWLIPAALDSLRETR